ncbi:MAG: hypothetical protein RIT45_3880, partial [Pseudomonadota bacterium]
PYDDGRHRAVIRPDVDRHRAIALRLHFADGRQRLCPATSLCACRCHGLCVVHFDAMSTTTRWCFGPDDDQAVAPDHEMLDEWERQTRIMPQPPENEETIADPRARRTTSTLQVSPQPNWGSQGSDDSDGNSRIDLPDREPARRETGRLTPQRNGELVASEPRRRVAASANTREEMRVEPARNEVIVRQPVRTESAVSSSPNPSPRSIAEPRPIPAAPRPTVPHAGVTSRPVVAQPAGTSRPTVPQATGTARPIAAANTTSAGPAATLAAAAVKPAILPPKPVTAPVTPQIVTAPKPVATPAMVVAAPAKPAAAPATSAPQSVPVPGASRGVRPAAQQSNVSRAATTRGARR